MDILLVTPRFPYPTRTGDTLTVFHMLKHFSLRHAIDLISCTSKLPAPQDTAAVAPFCRSIHTVRISPLQSVASGAGALLRRKPLQSAWFFTRRVTRIVEQLLRRNRYDVLYAHTIRTARYLIDLKLPSPPLRVLAMQISMRLNYQRMARHERNPLYRLIFEHEAARLGIFESELVEQFDRALVISEVDRAAICGRDNGRFFECPHGVTLDDEPIGAGDREPNTIVFSGNMNYRPNVDAAMYFFHDIFPRIRARIPDAVFFIVGANPDARIRDLSSDASVNVTGEVDALYPWLRRASVGIDPLRAGAGLQNKVLEGMACGLPMVVTPVANEGIKADPETHLLAADSASGFADQVIRLLEDAELRRRLGDSGRRFIEENWTWDMHFNRLERLFEEDVRAKRGSAQQEFTGTKMPTSGDASNPT